MRIPMTFCSRIAFFQHVKFAARLDFIDFLYAVRKLMQVFASKKNVVVIAGLDGGGKLGR